MCTSESGDAVVATTCKLKRKNLLHILGRSAASSLCRVPTLHVETDVFLVSVNFLTSSLQLPLRYQIHRMSSTFYRRRHSAASSWALHVVMVFCRLPCCRNSPHCINTLLIGHRHTATARCQHDGAHTETASLTGYCSDPAAYFRRIAVCGLGRIRDLRRHARVIPCSPAYVTVVNLAVAPGVRHHPVHFAPDWPRFHNSIVVGGALEDVPASYCTLLQQGNRVLPVNSHPQLH